MLSFHELFFNVDNGYLEGLVRGFRSGVLTQSDYLNLSQCETLEGNDVEVIFSLRVTENLSGKFIAIFLVGCLEYVKRKSAKIIRNAKKLIIPSLKTPVPISCPRMQRYLISMLVCFHEICISFCLFL